ncbi:MAG: hypothetical protein U1D30_01775 [Planctomycetota bacterium]
MLSAHDQDTANRCFEKAILIGPDWLVALEIGTVLLHYRYPSKAARWFERVTEQASDAEVGWLFLSRAQTAMGMTARAKQSLEHCLRLVPGHAEASRELNELENDASSWTGRLVRRWFSR